MKKPNNSNFCSEIRLFLKKLDKQDKKNLRSLPWYFVVGNPKNGKTSFLSKVDLSFISERRFIKNNVIFSFKIYKECIFVDFSINADAGERIVVNAMHFLIAIFKAIKRYRFELDLKGVIYTVALSDINFSYENNAAKKYFHISPILTSICQLLKMKIPLYMVLTKCDLISGFGEFFAGVSKEVRNQACGIDFPKLYYENKQLLEHFEIAFERLIETLNAQLLLKLEQEKTLKNRELIAIFPQQMYLLGKALYSLLLQEQLVQLRGVYFSSSFQEGASLDIFNNIVCQYFSLNSAFEKTLQQQGKSQPFFVNNFFKEILLKDKDLVFKNTYWLQSYQGGLLFLLMSFVLCTVFFVYSYSLNKENLQKISKYSVNYEQAVNKFSSSHKSISDVLPILNSLKNIQDIYGSNASLFVWLELYQPLKIYNSIQFIWKKRLLDLMTPSVVVQLQKLLKQHDLAPEMLYQALKGYLVFDGTKNADAKWVKSPVTYASIHQLQYNEEQQQQLNAYLDEAFQKSMTIKLINPVVLENVRQRLQKMPALHFAYYDMKQALQRDKKQFNIADELGGYFYGIFNYKNKGLLNIPMLYTYKGYKDLQGKRNAWIRKHLIETYKILGLDQGENDRAFDVEMTPKLWSLYAEDYITYWQSLLSNVYIAPFASLSEAIQIVDRLTHADNGLLKFLQLLRENTSPLQQPCAQVSQQFSAVNEWIKNTKSNAQYQQLFKTLSALHDYLLNLNNMPNVEQAAFQDVAAIMQNKLPNNPIVLLRSEAQKLPMPLAGWMLEISDNSMQLLLQAAYNVSNKAWQSKVLPFYEAHIQGRFPLAHSVDNNATIADFSEFFGGKGILLQFFQDYLAPFIDTTSPSWHRRHIDQKFLDISETTLLQLQQAYSIHNMYFKNRETMPVVQFAIKPLYLDAESTNVTVQLASQSLRYRHGPQQSLNWQWSVSDARQANIAFTDFQGHSYSHSFDGLWSWLELLNVGELTNSDIPGRYIWTIKNGIHKASFELFATDSFSVFDLQILKDFKLSQNL